MKVFLSWSGTRSKAVAEAFCWWLPQVIQSIDPWLSSDIEKGARWSPEISNQLESTRVGIVCLTEDNLAAPWILFESGALSKTKEAYVCTFLLDIKPASVEPPLGQFQHTTLQKDDVGKLLQTINTSVGKSGERMLLGAQLENAFDVWWPKLEDRLKGIAPADGGGKRRAVMRGDRDLLEEILEIVRGIQRPPTGGLPEPDVQTDSELPPIHHYRVSMPGGVDMDKPQIRELTGALVHSLRGFHDFAVTRLGTELRIDIETRGPNLARLKEAVKQIGGGLRVEKRRRKKT